MDARALSAVLATMCLVTAPGTAQLVGGVSFAWSSDHLWRGLVRSAGPVAQSDMFVGVERSDWRLAAGYWVNLQLGSGDPAAWSELGTSRHRITEGDPWLELGWLGESIDLRGGLAWYRYRGVGTTARRTAADNTYEVYARLSLPRALFTPSATLSIDLDRARGGFVETRIIHPLPFLPLIANLDLVGTAGISIGQQRDPTDAAETWVSERGGITYLGVGVVGNAVLGAFTIQTMLDLQLNTDDATRQVAPGRRRDWSAWIGTAVAWRHGGRP